MDRPQRLIKVEQAISAASGVTIEDIRSKSRLQEITQARHAVWWVAYEFMYFSYPNIADAYERDHTTIMHGVKKIRNSGEETQKKIKEVMYKYCPEVMTGQENTPKSIEKWQV